MTFTPIYLRNVHRYSVEMTGFLSAATTLFSISSRTFFGYVNDRIGFWSELTKINVFNTICLLGPAVCYLVIGFASADNHLVAVVSIIFLYMCYAASGGGFYKCATFTCR